MNGGPLTFKRELRAQAVQDGEYTFYELQNPGSDAVRLYDFEYNLAMEIDGRPFDAVAASANSKYGLELTAEQVEAFVGSLEQLGLLRREEAPRSQEKTSDDGAPEKRGEWHRDQSEPTTLMDGMDGIAQLLDQVSRQPDPVMAARPTTNTAAREEGRVRSSAPTEDDITAPAPPKSPPTSSSLASASAPPTVGPPKPPSMGLPGMPPMPPLPPTPITPLAPITPHAPPPHTPAVAAAPVSVPPPPAPPTVPLPGLGSDDEDAVLDVAAMARDNDVQGAPQPPRPAMSSPMSARDFKSAATTAPVPRPVAAELSVPPQAAGRSKTLMWAVLGIIVALAVAAFAIYKFVLPGGNTPVSVHTVSPSPVSVYRWFDAVGTIEKASPRALVFPAAGKVIDVRPVGSRFAAQDVLALLEGGKLLQNQVLHSRERLAFYQQILESMQAEDNRPEIRQAEIKIAEKAQLLEESQQALARYAIIASSDGEVAETLVAPGERVETGQPALRVSGSLYRAVFEFGRDDAARAGRLAFCRVLVDDRPVDCRFAPSEDDDMRIVVELDDRPEIEAGRPVRLARTRFDAVFAVPSSALVKIGEGDRLFVASPNGRAEMRAVSLAERTGDEAIITQGIDVGDDVIAPVPAALAPNALVSVAERRMQ